MNISVQPIAHPNRFTVIRNESWWLSVPSSMTIGRFCALFARHGRRVRWNHRAGRVEIVR